MQAQAIVDAHAKRLAALDPLLPAVGGLQPEADSTLLTASVGTSGAEGLVSSRERAPEEAEAIWHTLRERHLTVRIGGVEAEDAFSALLDRWDSYLREHAEAGDGDSSAVVLRPSRDTVGNAALLRHGFAPVRVTAARPADRLGSGPSATPGVSIRPAEPADLRTLTALHLELLRFDAQFGLVTQREDTDAMIRSMMRASLGSTEPTLWIAELYGKPLGMVQVQLPPAAEWAAGYVNTNQVGYLAALAVAERARSAGVGTALAAHAHQVFDQARTEVVLLHHGLANPRSTPFWYAQGYRPLWTYWHRYPAVR